MKTKPTVKTNLAVQTYEFLGTLTRDQLRALATKAKVKTGRDKKNTIANLARAISDGKLWFKTTVDLFTPPTVPGAFYTRTRLFSKKFRSYKPDRVVVSIS